MPVIPDEAVRLRQGAASTADHLTSLSVGSRCRHTASVVLAELDTYRSGDELERYQIRFGFEIGDQPDDDYFIGVRMGHVFDLAKEYVGLARGGSSACSRARSTRLASVP